MRRLSWLHLRGQERVGKNIERFIEIGAGVVRRDAGAETDFVLRDGRIIDGGYPQSTLAQFMPQVIETLAVADVGRGEVRFASAGHPQPFHVQRSHNVVEPLVGSEGTQGPALGVFEDSKYVAASRPLAPALALSRSMCVPGC